MTNSISVTIPVGPRPSHRRWLFEALDSIAKQTEPPSEVIIIDDQAHITNRYGWLCTEFISEAAQGLNAIRVETTPWLSGVAHAFNYGVAFAPTEHVIMMGSDDLLAPHAVRDCLDAIGKHGDEYGYYWMDVEYMDTGETQALPCHAAMVTKGLWNLMGGFPVESAIGAPDTILVSMMLGSDLLNKHLIRVESATPPYKYRRHPESETGVNGGRFQGAVSAVRDYYTANWDFAHWTKGRETERKDRGV